MPSTATLTKARTRAYHHHHAAPELDAAQILSLAEPTAITLAGLQLINRAALRPWAPQDSLRKVYEVEQLTAHIRELRANGEGIAGTGILNPLTVRPNPDGETFAITSGDRRYYAAEKAEIPALPCLVIDEGTDAAHEHAFMDNALREGLTPLEQATAVTAIMARRGYSVRRMAERLGVNKSWIEDRQRLLRSAPDVQRMVSVQTDTLTHARFIEPVKDRGLRTELIRSALAGAPVQAIRRRIAETTAPPPAYEPPAAPQQRLTLDDFAPPAETPNLMLQSLLNAIETADHALWQCHTFAVASSQAEIRYPQKVEAMKTLNVMARTLAGVQEKLAALKEVD